MLETGEYFEPIMPKAMTKIGKTIGIGLECLDVKAISDEKEGYALMPKAAETIGTTGAKELDAVDFDKLNNDIVIPQYTITVISESEEKGTASGSGTYKYGTQVQISATANEGYEFSQWNDSNTDNPRTITVTGDTTYTAMFNKSMYTITVVADPISGGTTTGSGTYGLGSSVEITATAKYGYSFVRWDDSQEATASTRTITVTGNATYKALFKKNKYTIIVEPNDTIMGSTTSGGTYDYLSAVTIGATANTGYILTKWGDNNTDNPRTIEVTGNTNYTAIFEADTKTKTVHYGATEDLRYDYILQEIGTAEILTGCCTWDGTNGILVYDTTINIIPDNKFSGLTKLKSIIIPNNVTYVGNLAFSECTNLTDVTLLSSNVNQIGIGAFSDCTSLTSMTLPANLTIISDETFSGCTSLTAITMFSSVESIGKKAFYDCSSLSTIRCYRSEAPSIVTTTGEETFKNLPSTGTLYVPTGSDYSTWTNQLGSGWNVIYE